VCGGDPVHCLPPLEVYVRVLRRSRVRVDAVEELLEKNPVIKDAPKFGKRVLEEAEVREIRTLRDQGWELEKIAERFGITGSAVSHICTGRRHHGGR
jgi:hypothetical protein